MALSWRAKRQLGYFSVLAAAALIFVYHYFISPALNVGPSCFDGRQNGDEQGIDCGGSCSKLCSFQSNNILVKWARVLPVTSSIYNAVAYVENQNSGSAVREISYEFLVYDEAGIFITSRSGSTFIGPAGRFAVFEPAISVGNRVPAKTLFKFTEVPVWEKIDKRWETFPIAVLNKNISNPASSPKLTADIANNSIYGLDNVGIISILYDADGIALAASRTVLDKLPGNSKSAVSFTWPAPFKGAVSSTDIFPDINPFASKL
jgi:hypothetical protein